MAERPITGAERAERWIEEQQQRQSGQSLPAVRSSSAPAIATRGRQCAEVLTPATPAAPVGVQQMAHAGLQFLWNCGNCNDKSVNDDVYMLGLFPDVEDNPLRRRMIAVYPSANTSEIIDALAIIKHVYYGALNKQECHRKEMRHFINDPIF